MIASSILKRVPPKAVNDPVEHHAIVYDVRKAFYASKICSYVQGMNSIRSAVLEGYSCLDLGIIARIWKVECIIRARFLDIIQVAYDRNADSQSSLIDHEFSVEFASAQNSWRRVSTISIHSAISVLATVESMAYYDSFRGALLVSA